jgi:hypothetical protein
MNGGSKTCLKDCYPQSQNEGFCGGKTPQLNEKRKLFSQGIKNMNPL